MGAAGSLRDFRTVLAPDQGKPTFAEGMMSTTTTTTHYPPHAEPEVLAFRNPDTSFLRTEMPQVEREPEGPSQMAFSEPKTEESIFQCDA